MLHIPLMSRIEYTEAVRTLPASRRMTYTLASTLALIAGFSIALATAILVTISAYSLLLEGNLRFDDVLVLALPAASAFMVSIGFSSHPMPVHVLPGDTLRAAVRQVARKGLLNGAITGFLFGLVWSLVIRVGVLYTNFNTIFHREIYVGEILIFSGIVACAVAPTFAAFRAFVIAAGHYLLYRIGRPAA